MSLFDDLAHETLIWVGDEDSGREDCLDEVAAYALASYVRGRAVTPRGCDDTDTLREGR